MTDILLDIEKPILKSGIPPFSPGDSIRVHVKVREGEKERIQMFAGVVIARRSGGARETFTVRKISGGIGVERIFPLHSPIIDRIEVERKGAVRRAKLYYLRGRKGKAARITRSRRTRARSASGRDPRPPGRSVRGARPPARSLHPGSRASVAGLPRGSRASTRPGRGSLAGPVVAGAVILPARCVLPGLDDSKRLDAESRARLDREIRRCAVAFGVGVVEAREIDARDILRASLEAMRLAVSRAHAGARRPPRRRGVGSGVRLPQLPVIHGDALSASIAAASVVAKVHRDSLLDAISRRHPAYGFEQHKGYGTPEHWEALRLCGPCPEHRLTYRGVVPEPVRGPPGSPAGAPSRLESSQMARHPRPGSPVRREAACPGASSTRR